MATLLLFQATSSAPLLLQQKSRATSNKGLATAPHVKPQGSVSVREQATQSPSGSHKQIVINEEGSGTEKAHFDYVFWGFVISLTLALTTVVLAIIAASQAAAVVKAERSWLLVSKVGGPPENWLAELKNGYIPGIAFRFGVFGNTPVKVTEARFVLHPVPAREGSGPPQAALPEPPDYSQTITNEAVRRNNLMPPGGTVEIRQDLLGLTEQAAEDLRQGKTILCGYGFLKYIDAFGKSRETATCWIYDFAWGGVLTDPEGTVLNPPGFRPGGPASYHRAT